MVQKDSKLDLKPTRKVELNHLKPLKSGQLKSIHFGGFGTTAGVVGHRSRRDVENRLPNGCEAQRSGARTYKGPWGGLFFVCVCVFVLFVCLFDYEYMNL